MALDLSVLPVFTSAIAVTTVCSCYYCPVMTCAAANRLTETSARDAVVKHYHGWISAVRNQATSQSFVRTSVPVEVF